MPAHPTPFVIRFAVLGLALLATAAQGEPHLATSEQRIADLEARIAVLEAQLSAAGGDANLDDEARLGQLEGRMARIEQLLTDAPSRGALAVTAAAEEAPAVDSLGLNLDQNAPSTLAEDRALFLPSRSLAGGPLHYGEGSGRVEFHAFLDLEYTDAGPDGSRDGNSTFDNHHANIFVRSQIRPNLVGHMEVEFEHSGDVVEIDQAYLAWAAQDWLTLKAGRFYTPFGIERFTWYSPTNALVSRPAAMRQIVPGNFYANGLVAEGVLEPVRNQRFTYELAITDGLGGDALDNRRGSRQTRDNNASRAVSARLGYAPSRRFEFGASVHQQRYDGLDDVDLDLRFVGFDFSGRWQGFELRSEWVRAVLDTPAYDPAGALIGTGEREEDGWYAQLAYSFVWNRDFMPELRLVGRYDDLDLNRDLVGNNDQRSWTLGLNALIYDHLRFKVEYQRAMEHGPDLDNDAFRAQFVIDY